MDKLDSMVLKPLASADGEPVFSDAWQAQALAIADTLVGNGLFSASQWSQSLGLELSAASSRGDIDNQETYYRCVLNALETLVAESSEIDCATMQGKRREWEQAYLDTPHGQPVRLPTDADKTAGEADCKEQGS